MIATSEASGTAHLSGKAPATSVLGRFRTGAEQRLKDLAPPSRRDQRWRFADLKRARLEGLDHWRPVGLEVKGLRPGVCCLSLTEAFERDGALVGRMLENLYGPLGSEYFMAHAFQSDLLSGVCLWVDGGVAAEEAVVLERVVADGEGTSSGVTLVVVGNGASVSVLERFRGVADGRGNFLAAAGVEVGAGGNVHYTVSQELPKASHLVQCAHLELAKDAQGEVGLFNLGASWVRQEVTAVLRETGGSANLLGLNLLEHTDSVDQHTRQRHGQPHGSSDLLFKNALFDESRAVFGGLIQVEEGAHFTDAYQSCRNLLLSDDAEANAMPGLEINADQVRCSHGATTGRIDPEELFYLAARGIREEAARHLITLGFACEVVDRLGHPQIREMLRERVVGALRRRASAGA